MDQEVIPAQKVDDTATGKMATFVISNSRLFDDLVLLRGYVELVNVYTQAARAQPAKPSHQKPALEELPGKKSGARVAKVDMAICKNCIHTPIRGRQLPALTRLLPW